MLGKISVEVKGLCDMLHSNPERMKEKQVDIGSPEWEKKEFELAQYKDSKGRPYIPASHFEESLIIAGSKEKYKGQQSYASLFKCGIKVFPEKVYFCNGVKIRPFGCWAVVRNGSRRSRVWRIRALIEKGWRAKFEIEVFNNEVNFEVLKNALTYAGAFVGLGDWRPKYGRFEVISIKKES